MSRFHVRCMDCQARQVLRMRPDEYIRPRKCRACGKSRFRIDKWMQERNTRALGCMCIGYKWAGIMSGAMHRKGSKACWFRKDGTPRVPGDKDFYDEEWSAANAA